jgi:hypothetical protein
MWLNQTLKSHLHYYTVHNPLIHAILDRLTPTRSDVEHCLRDVLMHARAPHELRPVCVPADLLVAARRGPARRALVAEVEQLVQVQPPALACQVRVVRRRDQAARMVSTSKTGWRGRADLTALVARAYE